MKRCVAYCRVSTDSTDQKNSIEAQKDYYLNKFKSEGYNPAKVGLLYKKNGEKEKITGIFADEGISGTSLKRREAFNTMIEYAKKGAFNVIYVKDISRFTRSVEDGTKILKDLKEVGVAVIFEQGNINSLNPTNEMVLNMLMSVAQEESRFKSDRVKWGMKRLYERGGWNGSAPYGYNNRNGYLFINENEAETVKKIFDMYLNKGDGVAKIARWLNNENIPTRKDTKWSQIQVTRILCNEIYSGVQRNHVTESIDVNRNIKRKVEEDEHIVIEKEELRIVDKDMFLRVQEERSKRNEIFTRGSHHSNKHLLSSLLYCSNCGSAYKRKKRHTYSRKDGTSKDIGYEWTCAINDMYGKVRCNCRNAVIEEDVIERIKYEVLRLKTENHTLIFDLYMRAKFKFDANENNLNELNEKREELKSELRQIRKDLGKGIMSEGQYEEEAKELNTEISNIDSEVKMILSKEEEIENAKHRYNDFVSFIKEINVEELTNTTLKRIFKDIMILRVENGDGSYEKELDFNYYFVDMDFNKILRKSGSFPGLTG